jgi:hypothetical protein
MKQPPAQWIERYGKVVDSDSSVSCAECGHTLVGDGPAIEIICVECFQRGVILSDRVVCVQCAHDNAWHGRLTTDDSHPDGFTCDECGSVTTPEGA